MMHLYVLTNSVNGKRYVGQSVNLKARLQHHKIPSATSVIARAIQKYGWGAFVVKTCDVETIDEANELEEFLIDFLGSHVSQHGYNIKLGGDNYLGQQHSAETRRKMSEAHMGHKVSEETREKIRATNTGFKHSRETKEKLREINLGLKKPAWVGRKISKANTGKKHTVETKAKMSASQRKRKPVSDETRKKISEAGKGRIVSAETRAKMSASQKARQARLRAEQGLRG